MSNFKPTQNQVNQLTLIASASNALFNTLSAINAHAEINESNLIIIRAFYQHLLEMTQRIKENRPATNPILTQYLDIDHLSAQMFENGNVNQDTHYQATLLLADLMRPLRSRSPAIAEHFINQFNYPKYHKLFKALRHIEAHGINPELDERYKTLSKAQKYISTEIDGYERENAHYMANALESLVYASLLARGKPEDFYQVNANFMEHEPQDSNIPDQPNPSLIAQHATKQSAPEANHLSIQGIKNLLDTEPILKQIEAKANQHRTSSAERSTAPFNLLEQLHSVGQGELLDQVLAHTSNDTYENYTNKTRPKLGKQAQLTQTTHQHKTLLSTLQLKRQSRGHEITKHNQTNHSKLQRIRTTLSASFTEPEDRRTVLYAFIPFTFFYLLLLLFIFDLFTTLWALPVALSTFWLTYHITKFSSISCLNSSLCDEIKLDQLAATPSQCISGEATIRLALITEQQVSDEIERFLPDQANNLHHAFATSTHPSSDQPFLPTVAGCSSILSTQYRSMPSLEKHTKETNPQSTDQVRLAS